MAAVHFCRTRFRTVLFASLAVMLALGLAFVTDTLAGGGVMVVLVLLNVLTQWALLRRGEVGVMVAMFTLSPFVNLPQLLGAPIANAGTLAAVSCAVTLALTWWVLRYGRSLGGERT